MLMREVIRLALKTVWMASQHLRTKAAECVCCMMCRSNTRTISVWIFSDPELLESMPMHSSAKMYSRSAPDVTAEKRAAEREVLLRRVELAVGRGRARPVAGHAERRRRLAAREAAGGRLGDDGGGLRGHDFATCAVAAVVKRHSLMRHPRPPGGVPRPPGGQRPNENFLIWAKSCESSAENELGPYSCMQAP